MTRRQDRKHPPDAPPERALGRLLGATLAFASAFALTIVALTSLMTGAMAAEIGRHDTQGKPELIRFVRQECGFCHGLRLTGGLGTPLTAEALAERPAEALEATILYGRPSTAMPGWAPFLSEADTAWIVQQLLRGFPDETPIKP